MTLTETQRYALAQRIFAEFNSFVTEELDYQIEDMKDNDELNWDYFVDPSDRAAISEILVDLIAVPVG